MDAQPGVGAARVNLPEGEVLIDYDPTRVSEDQLLQAVTAVGFDVGDAAGRGGQRPDDDDAKLFEEGRRLLALIALSLVTVPLMLFRRLTQPQI